MAKFKHGNLIERTSTESLSANKILLVSDAQSQFLDPGAADRTITLPLIAFSDGLLFLITNASSTYNLIIENESATEISTIGPGLSSSFMCNGTIWEIQGNTEVPFFSATEPTSPRAGMTWIDTS